jgi:hypothetical protein
MPINMEHARRIAGTATQTEDTRNVRENVPSRAWAKAGTVAKWQ